MNTPPHFIRRKCEIDALQRTLCVFTRIAYLANVSPNENEIYVINMQNDAENTQLSDEPTHTLTAHIVRKELNFGRTMRKLNILQVRWARARERSSTAHIHSHSRGIGCACARRTESTAHYARNKQKRCERTAKKSEQQPNTRTTRKMYLSFFVCG